MIKRIELIPITDKWETAKARNAKRMRRTRIFMSEYSPRYEALRRVQLALYTSDPIEELEKLLNEVTFFIAFGDIEILSQLRAYVIQQDVYAQAISELQ